jgi:hypothetical protein
MTYVFQSSSTYISNCHPPPDAQTGQVFYDSGIQSMVVYNGGGWIPLPMPTAMLTYDAEQAIAEIIILLAEHKSLNEMAAKHPLIADAVAQLETVLKLHKNI